MIGVKQIIGMYIRLISLHIWLVVREILMQAEDVCHSFEDVMNYLSKNNSGRDYDIWVIQMFLQNVEEENREFYEQMITKKFRLGQIVKLLINVYLI